MEKIANGWKEVREGTLMDAENAISIIVGGGSE